VLARLAYGCRTVVVQAQERLVVVALALAPVPAEMVCHALAGTRLSSSSARWLVPPTRTWWSRATAST
jgi:hypothetical protein